MPSLIAVTFPYVPQEWMRLNVSSGFTTSKSGGFCKYEALPAEAKAKLAKESAAVLVIDFFLRIILGCFCLLNGKKQASNWLEGHFDILSALKDGDSLLSLQAF